MYILSYCTLFIYRVSVLVISLMVSTGIVFEVLQEQKVMNENPNKNALQFVAFGWYLWRIASLKPEI